MWTMFVLALGAVVLLFSVYKCFEALTEADRFKLAFGLFFAVLSSVKIGYIVYGLLWL